MPDRDLGIYIHIPFCVRKCLYCDFLSFPVGMNAEKREMKGGVKLFAGQKAGMAEGGRLCAGEKAGRLCAGQKNGTTEAGRLCAGQKNGTSGASAEDAMRIYTEALLREIRSYAETARGRRVDSIYLGGGTPSLMPADCLEKIFEELYGDFDISPDAEITMEMNPGTVTEEILSFASLRLTRVSLGVQSFEDAELRAIGRIHTARDADRTFKELRKCGIRNISLDLMYGLPGQSEESLRRTLEHAMELHPEHISAYSLIVEEGTPFGNRAKEGSLHLPDEETESRMADLVESVLGGRWGDDVSGTGSSRARYEHYEISNFAKEGFRCRHNVRYWRRGDYLGFGPGAASLFDETRWSDTRNMKDYLEHSAHPGLLVRDRQRLTVKDAMEEFMFLGLRMADGVSDRDFSDAFGRNIEEVYGNILSRHIAEGLMVRNGGRYALTHRGMEVSNPVMAEYLLDD